MKKLSRRSVLRGSAGLVAVGALARPHIANAEATTATAWFAQGFIPSEDVALHKLVADYEKTSGNAIELSIVPFVALRQKEVAAVTSGVVPELMEDADFSFTPLNAWDDKLLDVSDIIETQKSQYSEVVLLGRHLYNNVTKARSYYGVPMKAANDLPYLDISGREGRLQDVRHPEYLGCLYRFFPADASQAAQPGDASRLCPRRGSQHQRGGSAGYV